MTIPPEAPPADGMAAVYRLYDATDALLYVGSTGNLPKRWEAHGRTKSWWSSVATYSLEWHASREDAFAAEGVAIRNGQGIHNVAGTPLQGERVAAAFREWMSVARRRLEGVPEELVSFRELARKLAEAGIVPAVSHQRISQLSREDPDFPPVVTVGRSKAVDWHAALPYFRARKGGQGRRVDLEQKRSAEQPAAE